jgi:capsular polysaccharide biosynthesis protein
MSKKIKMPELGQKVSLDNPESKSKCKLCEKPTEHTFCSKKCYEVYNSEPKPKGKVGRPKKVVADAEQIETKKMGRPKKVVNVEVKPKSKRGRPKKVVEKKVVESPIIHIYNELEGLRNILKEKLEGSNNLMDFDEDKIQRLKQQLTNKNIPEVLRDKIKQKLDSLEGKKSTKNPLDAYTKKTNIIFDEPTISKERLALQISNEQVDSLKKTNQKLIESNNKYIAELADLKFKSELNSVPKKGGLDMDKLEELIFTFLEKVQSNEDSQIISLRNQNANQNNTINELQGVIGNLTREIKDLKEQDITDEVSKKQFEKSVGKKVLSFFIAFVSGLIAAILFMIALA